jgi:DNA-binding transcriptional LysR family regulator
VEIQQVRSFVQVAREKSFSRAASSLGRTQPTITAAVAALERQLRVKLFDRSPRAVVLTPAGQAFLELIAPLLESWEAAPGNLHEVLDGEMRGPVRIGAGEAAVLYLLPRPIRRFLEAHPQVEIVIRHQTQGETVTMLREGEIDFGVRSLERVPPDLAYEPFLSSDRVLISTRNHPVRRARKLTLDVLSKHPFVMPWRMSATRKRIERALGARRLPCRIAIEAGGWEIVKQYVAMGFGIAVIPEFCLERTDRGLAARSVRHLLGEDSYGLVFRKGRSLSLAAKALTAEFKAKSEGSELRRSSSR